MATKKFLDYDGLKTFWSKVKTHVSTTAMSKDGSNYEGGLMLVTPVIKSQWTILDSTGNTILTSNNTSIAVENGAIVNFKGNFSYPTPSSSQKAPTACSGDFGNSLPAVGESTAPISKSTIFTNAAFTVKLTAPKSGLEISNGKVVKPSGNDDTSATASVSFFHKRFWGVSESQLADITSLSSELSNSRAKSITFDCSGGKYFYFAYPTALGDSTWKVGGLDFTGFIRSTKTLTNEYGKSITYYVYRSTDIQYGASINAVIA